jgi:glycosyltransferase involved in cell wall biosynthesis
MGPSKGTNICKDKEDGMMNGAKHKKLTACMMVKNEADNLHRCLSSIKDVVDEIVVVDTGSTDDSIAICKEYGAKVYEHKGGEGADFSYSLHRNQSIGYATGDFILIIDADEELIVTSKDGRLQDWLVEWPENVKFAKVHLMDIQKDRKSVEFNPPRIFRNGFIQYGSIVHNKPMVEGYDYALCSGAHIRHYGYDLSPEKKKIKHERTKMLLLRRIDEDPKDYEAYYYLSQNADWVGDQDNTIMWGKKFLATEDIHKSVFCKSLYVTIAKCYLQKKDYTECLEWITTGLEKYKDDLDLIFLLAEYAFAVRDATIGMQASAKFVDLFDKFHYSDLVEDNSIIYSYNNSCLSTCLYHMVAGHVCEASDALKRLETSTLDIDPGFKKKIILNMRSVLTKHGFSLIQEDPEAKRKSNVVLLTDKFDKRKKGDKKRMAILDPMGNKFAAMIADYFTAQGYETKLLDNQHLSDAIKWPDVVLSLWANEALATLTGQGGDLPPIISYLRSYEMLTPQLMNAIQWEKVSGMIFVADHIQELTNEKWKEKVANVPQTVINNFVRIKDYEFNDSGPGNDLCYIGYLNHKKGLELLWQCVDRLVKINPKTRLHVAGSYQEVRFMVYTEHLLKEMGLTDNVIFHDWVKDIPEFLTDKSFVISTSPWEGCPNNIIEAMACGVKPLVHNWRGSKELFGSEFVFNTIDEMEAIINGPYQANKYRAFAGEKFNSKLQLKKVKAFINDCIISQKEVRHAAS